MEVTDRKAPLARKERLVVYELPDEVLVYDLERHRAHSLNRTAALVWRHCDGATNVADMAALLQRELNLPPDEELVWLALERLERARLLRERPIREIASTRSSRRALVRKLAAVGGLALVTSIVAPEAADAQCCGERGAPCSSTNRCCAGLECDGGTCGD
jgi:coenzyme PQQ synthesis protein D (PqqD)